MLRNLIRRLSGASLPEKLSYEESRKILETRANELKKELCVREDVAPEILYYLATDPDPKIRKEIAANRGTPAQADLVLAADDSTDVRCELARKIARILPDLDPDEERRTRELLVAALEKLARDVFPRVRAILAEELKSATNVPASVVKRLARDLETMVSAPILQYSPLLSDDDLIEIIAGAKADGALEAIARRNGLSSKVSDAVISSFDVPAVAALLVNRSAQIREEALDRLVEEAEAVETWHSGIVMRAELSVRAVRRIAGFVGASLLQTLSTRASLDAETAQHIGIRLRERLSEEKALTARDEDAEGEVERAAKRGALDDGFVAAAAEAGSKATVICALARLNRLPSAAIERIFAARSAKAITALVWRAGLPMRVAMKIQTFLLKLTQREMVFARAGVGFPLSEDEMRWHLSYFGING
ncbi:MAG TPA: DUF2336 domain-containing protein [Micropepsaceae bacterium]|nr:DUF2336 domain-containing protein [Micropepsaceae bacterium]